MREKYLQRLIGTGTLVSSRERRTFVVPRISRRRVGYPLSEPSRRRLVLPCHAPPPRRTDPPVIYPGFGLDEPFFKANHLFLA